MLICLLMTAVGFLSGSVMYSYIIPRLYRKIDIRELSADGNPGGANAIALSGALSGGICLACDILKAFAPVFVSVYFLQITDYRIVPIVAAPVFGHAFSPFMRFKGGKGVAVSFGALLGLITLSWAVAALVMTMIIFKFIIVLDPDSLKVMTGFIAACVLIVWLDPDTAVKISALLISAVVCGKHLINPGKGEIRIKAGPFAFDYSERAVKFGWKKR